MLVLAAAAGAVGCGDPVASANYLGEPLVTLRGQLIGAPPETPIERPYVAIAWQDMTGWDLRPTDQEPEVVIFEDGALEEPPPDSEMQTKVVTQMVRIDPAFQGGFELPLFEKPPERALSGEPGKRMAVAFIIAFDDVDRNGRVEVDPETGGTAAPDFTFGVSYTLLLWSEAPFEDPSCAGFGVPVVPAGYSALGLGFCTGRFLQLQTIDTPFTLIQEPAGRSGDDSGSPLVCEGDPLASCTAHPWLEGCEWYPQCVSELCYAQEQAYGACQGEIFMGGEPTCEADPCGDVRRAYEACAVRACGPAPTLR